MSFQNKQPARGSFKLWKGPFVWFAEYLRTGPMPIGYCSLDLLTQSKCLHVVTVTSKYIASYITNGKNRFYCKGSYFVPDKEGL